MHQARALLLLLLAAPLLAPGCAPPPARLTPGDTARRDVVADCRARADTINDRQNRRDLSSREDRDTPFSERYNSGITSRGLGQRYQWDRMVADCVAASNGGGSNAATTGPTFLGPRGQ